VIAGVRIGEAGIGVNGVNVNGEVRLAREVRETSPLLGVGVPEVGRCNREPERFLRWVDDGGIERISVAIPLHDSCRPQRLDI
jgi:hypothetical protein